jgi:hypothetical protein
MNIQPIDAPALLRAITWPVIVLIAFGVFRSHLSDLVGVLARNVRKFSFGGLSLELAQVPEMKPPQALETEIRQLEAGLYPQSGVPGITGLFNQLQRGGRQDYVVIDLGSETSRRWLTSRLYLLAFLIALLDRSLCLVFLETTGGIRKRFVGLASPSRVRWALARSYSWLEAAAASAYTMALGSLQCVPPGVLQLNPTATLQFDATTGFLPDYQLSQLVQQFLTLIRMPEPVPPTTLQDASEWVAVGNQVLEHAKWLDGARIEHVLGNDLDVSYVTLAAGQTFGDLGPALLQQRGHFVAIVDPDKTFRGLVDRSAVTEKLATEFAKQVSSNKP